MPPGPAGQIDSSEGRHRRLAEADRKAATGQRRQAEAEVEQNLGGPYSIPTYIVMCESGGNYSGGQPLERAGGAYQIMPSAWAAYGRVLPQDASEGRPGSHRRPDLGRAGPGAWSGAWS
ncbi:MAG: hypothetical protein H6532_03415 [Thermoleophilales bacterium]|nr:hypothetical protein [Thermoleophilales bacterium]